MSNSSWPLLCGDPVHLVLPPAAANIKVRGHIGRLPLADVSVVVVHAANPTNEPFSLALSARTVFALSSRSSHAACLAWPWPETACTLTCRTTALPCMRGELLLLQLCAIFEAYLARGVVGSLVVPVLSPGTSPAARSGRSMATLPWLQPTHGAG
jgi:hypothetical protein